VLDEAKQFGNPLMVFTAGSLLKRPDIFDLLQHSVAAGLRTNFTPSATPLPNARPSTNSAMWYSRMATSVDGPDALKPRGFRHVDGTYE
jgi:hypothetical protein